jgi:hypothetical protein
LKPRARGRDTVTVTDTSGNAVTGPIADLSSSSLGLLVGGTRRDLAEGDVKTISQGRHASLATGAKWGLIAGAGFGAVVGLAQDWDNSDIPAGVGVLAEIGYMAGFGSAIGVGVSALIRTHHVIFAKPGAPSATLTVSPLVTRERKGVALSLRF